MSLGGAPRQNVSCVVVCVPRFVRCVADRGCAHESGDSERADHVEGDSGLSLGVPSERARVDEVEEVVGYERSIVVAGEMVGGDVVLRLSGGDELCALGVIGGVSEGL